jgi:SAM-dependent methyltransferase
MSFLWKQRERGFVSNPYPCIGQYRFTILTLHTHPLYPSIVERLKQPGAAYLDIGCCFGQDLRRLVHDGVPPENLAGVDIAPALMELGHELFRDRDTLGLRARFTVADVFSGDTDPAWAELRARGADVVHCSAFLHLFPLAEQQTAAQHIARLVRPGGVVVGRQVGSAAPGDVPAVQDGSLSYRHDVDTFAALWDRVGEETGTRWKTEGTMDMVGVNASSPVEDANSRRLLFTVTRVK